MRLLKFRLVKEKEIKGYEENIFLKGNWSLMHSEDNKSFTNILYEKKYFIDHDHKDHCFDWRHLKESYNPPELYENDLVVAILDRKSGLRVMFGKIIYSDLGGWGITGNIEQYKSSPFNLNEYNLKIEPSDYLVWFTDGEISRIELLGNKWENPELLENKL